MTTNIGNIYSLLLLLIIPVVWMMARRSFLRRIPARKRVWIVSIRSLLILLMVAALLNPHWLSHSDKVNLFFCLDISESVGRDQRERARTYMQRAASSMGEEDRVGLVLFGKDAAVEQPLGSSFQADLLRSQVNPNKTNIHGALQLAMGKFPPEGEHRILLFTDGNENLSKANDVAHQAEALGIRIHPVPLSSWFDRREVFIRSIQSPAIASLETPFEIRVTAVGSSDAQGDIALFKDHVLLGKRNIDIKPGNNVIRFADTLTDPGLHVYKAVINSATDTFFQNNEGMSFTRGAKRSRVLLVSGKPDEPHPVADVLSLQGIDVDRLLVKDIPGSLHDLLEYNAIILNNVSGRHLSLTAMENIETFVKDTGGGLIMIGGDKSFGAGYYKKTPVEDTLPVYMDAPTDLKFARLLLVFIIDKSSSMSASYSGKTKLEMAKIAAFSSIEMLNPTDSIGILAFDSEYHWAVPVIGAGSRKQIAERLSVLKEGGGTVLYPALREAGHILNGFEAGKKHIIVLSDGETDEADFETLVKTLRRSDVSVSTVSIGSDSNIDLMKSIAGWGGGRSYHTEDPQAIPKIFIGETKIVTKQLITEKTMMPQTILPDQMLQGIDTDHLPPIYGQVITYPKPGAGVLIQTSDGPLLSAWRYGLGRSVAFSSDLSGRWGREWVAWEHFVRFVSQMVKWTQRKETHRSYDVDFKRVGEQGLFRVDALSPAKEFVNYLKLETTIMFPSGKTESLSLDQTAPGRYQGRFSAEEIGRYYFTLYPKENDGTGTPIVFGYGIPYTDEFKAVGVNRPLLTRLASVTGGSVLSFDDPPDRLFAADTDTRSRAKPLWPYLAVAFLLCLLADVAIRKLVDLS